LIVVSYSADLAIKHGNDFRAVVNSVEYRAIFPGMRISAMKNTQTEVVAVAAEPPAKPHKKIARENRARPSGYAERFRTKSDKARHAERRRLKREAPIRYAPRYRREQFFPFYPAYGANWF